MKLIITLFLIYSFTPFPAITPATDSITVKGGLLTNNGTAQVESPPCANGEILEWDSAVTLGYKCVTKPSDSNAGAINISQSASTGAAQVGTITITAPAITTSGNPVRLTLMGAEDALGIASQFYGSGTGSNTFRRDGSIISTSTSLANRVPDIYIDSPSAGTYTYSVQVTDPQYVKLVVEEMGAATPAAAPTVAPNYGISASTGVIDITSTSYVDVTNLSVTITTTGGPVHVFLSSDPTSNGVVTSSAAWYLSFVRDATRLDDRRYNAGDNQSAWSGQQLLDTPSAGTYTYKLQTQQLTSQQVFFDGIKLNAIEVK